MGRAGDGTIVIEDATEDGDMTDGGSIEGIMAG